MDVDASFSLGRGGRRDFAASVRALESCGSLTPAQQQRLNEAKRKTPGLGRPGHATDNNE